MRTYNNTTHTYNNTTHTYNNTIRTSTKRHTHQIKEIKETHVLATKATALQMSFIIQSKKNKNAPHDTPLPQSATSLQMTTTFAPCPSFSFSLGCVRVSR